MIRVKFCCAYMLYECTWFINIIFQLSQFLTMLQRHSILVNQMII